ncbi:hypothetical protein BDZ85DRAFT_316789 [Elsinoe ampelina]|uniref:Uncharacterized protein n=1 Tax=Elsinoe ampelina TaxID=302913 RepID=A0A6A6GJQ8_9PEZI|nr:hypothetical protein BDZ85DRAFT_316789 [Elsinoe ampelina]
MPRGAIDYGARRLAKLNAQQASLPASERIMNRTDWDKHISTTVGVLTRQAHENAKRAFIETATASAVMICTTNEEAENYFRPGGTPFTCKVLRIFIEASALSRSGTIEEVPSRISLRRLLTYLFGAARKAGNPVQPAIRTNALLWVDNELIRRGLAHATPRAKPTAIPQDITTFLKKLFDVQYMTTLASTRDVLLIALFVCITVDCSTRVSEIMRPSMSAENLVLYKREHPQKFFTWSCVELFAFKTDNADTVYLQARLTFRDVKNTTRPNHQHSKTIPLRNLPVDMASEDTLFWLIVLGLIDKVFVGTESWSDFDRLKPGPNGLRVFRTPNRDMKTSKDDPISNEQMGSQSMVIHLNNLSRFCGLKHAMLPNVLRRSSAYILATTTSAEERRARMGHSTSDSVYWFHYRNKTSTTDVQGLRHGLQTEDVSRMSSIFLEAGDRTPPDRVSDAGMKAIKEDEVAANLLIEQSEMADQLVTQHRSLDQAQVASPDDHKRYVQARNKYHRRVSFLTESTFKKEYRAFFADHGVVVHERDLPTLAISPQRLVDSSVDGVDIADDPDPDIDSQEVEAEETNIDAAMTGLVTALAEDETDTHDAATLPNNLAISQSSRSFAPRATARYSLLDQVPDLLYNQKESTTHASLSAIFTDLFNHLHCADKFYPNQEPFPGTFECRFCGYHFLDLFSSADRGFSMAHRHADDCNADVSAEASPQALRDKDTKAKTTCPLGRLDKHQNMAPCWFKITGFQPLFDHPPQIFVSMADLRIHAINDHNAVSTLLKGHTPQGSIAREETIYFCHFCQVWIARAEEFEETHLSGHRDDLKDTLSSNGVAGLYYSNHWCQPGFCPFCVYNAGLSVVQRMHVFTNEQYLKHVAAHLKPDPTGDLTSHPTSGLTPDPTRSCCPASQATPELLPRCAVTSQMTAIELAEHLRTDHKLNVKAPAPALPEASSEPGAPAKRRKQSERKPLNELDANRGSEEAAPAKA